MESLPLCLRHSDISANRLDIKKGQINLPSKTLASIGGLDPPMEVETLTPQLHHHLRRAFSTHHGSRAYR